MLVGTTYLTLALGNIVQEMADVIVNAANSSLLGGGGVDGAIHRAGGPAILEECLAIRHRLGCCPTGEAVITTAGRLPARYVVHTVGPVWQGGRSGESELLRAAYWNSLTLAAEYGAATIAFPSISTGAYGYPIEKAAPIALGAARDFAQEYPSFREIRFVLFSERDLSAYRQALGALLPYPQAAPAGTGRSANPTAG
ncbi:MAG: O-acetyl-ADP-ribose deacetylase [Symbiobacteriaceae bacterium]|jgi:O-acetyl-ADP-ribose deacetylase (regulator of RNase III)|nr:O-acetyl-ADP-ribose deacetylase [Symbiobacteriaceae bacterium]